MEEALFKELPARDECAASAESSPDRPNPCGMFYSMQVVP